MIDGRIPPEKSQLIMMGTRTEGMAARALRLRLALLLMALCTAQLWANVIITSPARYHRRPEHRSCSLTRIMAASLAFSNIGGQWPGNPLDDNPEGPRDNNPGIIVAPGIGGALSCA